MGRPFGSKNRLQLGNLSDADATALRGMALRSALPTKRQLGRMQEIGEEMAAKHRRGEYFTKEESGSIRTEFYVLEKLLGYSLPPLAMLRVSQSDTDERLTNSGIVVLPPLNAVSVTDGQVRNDKVKPVQGEGGADADGNVGD